MGHIKKLKQIIHTEHNIIKNSNWPEANQLTIYRCGREFELGATVKQIQIVVKARLELEITGLRVRRAASSNLRSLTMLYWI